MPYQAVLEQLNVIVTIANSIPLEAVEETFRKFDVEHGKTLNKIVDASSRFKHQAGHEVLAAFVKFRRAMARAERKALQTIELGKPLMTVDEARKLYAEVIPVD